LRRSFSHAQGAGRGGTCPELGPLLAGRAAGDTLTIHELTDRLHRYISLSVPCSQMSADEYRLGNKANSEQFAHTVADFARQRQEVPGRTPIAHCQRQSVFA